jgi:PAS domain S-box-containing protein
MVASTFSVPGNLVRDPVVVVSTDGLIEACNEAFAAQLSIAPERLLGTSLDALAVEARSSLKDYLHACARSEQPVVGLIALQGGPDLGTYRCYGVREGSQETSASARVLLLLRLEGESSSSRVPTDALAKLNAEIMRRQQVEDSLRHQRETLQVTLASIGDGVIVTDAGGRVTFLNAVAENLTGWSVEQAKNQPFETVFRIVNERTGRAVEHPVSKVLETGGIVGLANHTVLIHREGRRIPIDDSGAPIRLPGGELFGIVVIFRDVTEHKNAEHARAWLAAIVDSSDDAIASKTLEGIVTSWNRGAVRLFGYEPEEIIGQSIMTIVPPELHAQEAETLARLRRGERIDHFETVRLAKDGHRVDISLTVSPIRDEEGEVIGASKTARDITERKRAEWLLREADRRKDEFLATLAHELRNPLAPIRNAAELLKRADSLNPQLRAVSTILERQVRQMTHLVDDLLDVSRITAGQVRLQREPIELSALLTAVIESYQSVFEAARHEVTVSAPTSPIYVSGDRIRLTQVFSNILHNAAKYTPPAGRIRIELHQQDDDVIVSIRDSGIGIPREMLSYVFELFAQLNRSYERTNGGLGLGLTLAKRLVELHDGSIEANSEGTNQGSEFVVCLPAAGPVSAEPQQVPRTDSDRAISRRVLIADDNHDAAVSLSLLLQTMGHETRIAHDGLEAVEAAEDFRPEVVLLDIAMPKLDGYEAARRIARRAWAFATRIIAVTGWGQDADRQRAREAGFHEHLVKPVDPETLSRLLGDTSTPP